MNIRQRIVSVVNLKKVLSLAEKVEEKAKLKVIVIEKGEVEFSLLVDEVVGSKEIEKEQIQSPPGNFSGIQKEILKGVTKEKLILLNGEILFIKKEFVVNRGLNGKGEKIMKFVSNIKLRSKLLILICFPSILVLFFSGFYIKGFSS